MSLSLHERTCPVRSGLRRPRNSILALLQVTRQFSTMSTAQRQRDGLGPHHVGKRGSPRLIFRTRIDVEQRETQLLHHRLIRLAQARLILILREDTNLGIKRRYPLGESLLSARHQEALGALDVSFDQQHPIGLEFGGSFVEGRRLHLRLRQMLLHRIVWRLAGSQIVQQRISLLADVYVKADDPGRVTKCF
jgi:hypothetical protein